MELIVFVNNIHISMSKTARKLLFLQSVQQQLLQWLHLQKQNYEKIIRKLASVWSFEVQGSQKCAVSPEMILLEERADRDRSFTYVLRQVKTVFFTSYYLCGRIHRFLSMSTLHMNGLCICKQFNSRYIDYAYQLIESVILLRK